MVIFLTFLPNDFFGGNSNLTDSGKFFLPFYQMISLVGIQTSLTVVNFLTFLPNDFLEGIQTSLTVETFLPFYQMISKVGFQTSLTVVNFLTFLPNDFLGGNSKLADSGKLSYLFTK